MRSGRALGRAAQNRLFAVHLGRDAGDDKGGRVGRLDDAPIVVAAV